jgi:hypothetical protein
MRYVFIAAVTLGTLAAAGAGRSETTIHISPRGDDGGSGAAAVPIRTLERLQALLDGGAGIGEVVFHGGVYRGRLSLHVPRGMEGKKLPPLVLRAAEGESPVIDGAAGLPAEKARPVAGSPGVYQLDGLPFRSEAQRRDPRGIIPCMWDRGARKRYLMAADLPAVQRFAASFTFTDGGLFFHTSDDGPPAGHDIEIGSLRAGGEGLRIARPDVTVRGLTARNYVSTMFSGGFCTAPGSQRVTFQDCRSCNCSRGFVLSGRQIRLLGCRADDVGCGVHVHGQQVRVEGGRFLRGPRDDFMVPMLDPQEDTGIEVYYPAGEEVTICGNVIKGFGFCAVFFKCDPGTFTVERNTLVDSPIGIGWSPSPGKRIVALDNILYGGGVEGQVRNQAIVALRAEGNVLWPQPWTGQRTLSKNVDYLNSAGSGNILADPRLAAPEADDFRLLPGSLCAARDGAAGRQRGALGVVPAGFHDAHPPLLDLQEQPRLAAVPDDTGDGPLFITSRRGITVRVRAHDAAGKVAQIRLRVGDGPWGDPLPYAENIPVQLPSDAGLFTVSVRAADESGNWSPPASIRVRAAVAPPGLVGTPVIRANRYGVVISLRTDAECYAVGQCGADGNYGVPLLHSGIAARGGPGPMAREHVLGALFSPRDSHRPHYFRLRLAGLERKQSRELSGTFDGDGKPQSYYVAPAGVDQESTGTQSAPWRTLQYAVNRALPGDSVIMLPGLYPEGATVTRGGMEGAPLAIRAGEKWKAVIDGRHRVRGALVEVEQAADVEIAGLELRWFGTREHSAIRVDGSPRVTVRECRIWNELCWGESRLGGTGIRIAASPDFTLQRSLLFRLDRGMILADCPRARIVQNTFRAFSHGGLTLSGSSLQGTVVRNNSLNYYGNYAYEIDISDPRDLKRFDSDYNNLGTCIRDEFWRREPGVALNLPSAVGNSKTVAYYVQSAATCVKPEKEAGPVPGENRPKGWKGEAMSRYRWVPNATTPLEERAKNLIGLQIGTFEDWQAFSGGDKHSIWADPRHRDILAFDFRLRPESPNIGAGEKGTTIGALPASP